MPLFRRAGRELFVVRLQPEFRRFPAAAGPRTPRITFPTHSVEREFPRRVSGGRWAARDRGCPPHARSGPRRCGATARGGVAEFRAGAEDRVDRPRDDRRLRRGDGAAAVGRRRDEGPAHRATAACRAHAPPHSRRDAAARIRTRRVESLGGGRVPRWLAKGWPRTSPAKARCSPARRRKPHARRRA